MTSIATTSQARPALGAGTTFAMAAAAAIAAANIYYNQPMLGLIERDMPGALTGYIPTATQFGYAVGLFLLVPLGDLVERRNLIVVQLIVLAAAMAGAAMAPSPATILAASLVLGVVASVAQQIVPFAARLAPVDKKGAVVGTVVAGILLGIVLSRTLAGFVATYFGWRDMFWLAVPLALAAAALMAGFLPRSAPEADLGYGRLLWSLGALWREFPALRLAAATQALLFGAFTAFWTILAFHLQEPRFGLGADVAGLFGIVGTVGIFAAPIAGRFADRRGPRAVIVAGALLTLLTWILFGAWRAMAGLIAGTILLDFATQSALVSNQTVVFALRPEAQARVNTIFIGTMFLGGAVGSAAATAAWRAAGWSGVTALGVALSALASALQAGTLIRRRHSS